MSRVAEFIAFPRLKINIIIIMAAAVDSIVRVYVMYIVRMMYVMTCIYICI